MVAISALALAVSTAAYADVSQGGGGWRYNPEQNPNDVGFGVWSRVDGLIVSTPGAAHQRPADRGAQTGADIDTASPAR